MSGVGNELLLPTETVGKRLDHVFREQNNHRNQNQSHQKSGKYGDPQNLVQCFLFALVLLEQNDLKIVVRHNGVLIGFLYRNAAAVPMLLQNITYQRFSLLAADLGWQISAAHCRKTAAGIRDQIETVSLR